MTCNPKSVKTTEIHENRTYRNIAICSAAMADPVHVLVNDPINRAVVNHPTVVHPDPARAKLSKRLHIVGDNHDRIAALHQPDVAAPHPWYQSAHGIV